MRQNDAGGMAGATPETAVAGARPVPRGISPCRPAAAAIHRESAATRAASRQRHVGCSMARLDDAAILTGRGRYGDDLAAWLRPFVVGVKAPMAQWALAMDRVRYVGEPIPMCKQLTREPVAGKPHTGFGGRGRRSPFPSAFISSSWGG
ncbi:MAG: hypothetical protein P4M03_03700 [Cupriavidus basilensis]|nr:hypothetical protein [Cupriavidus basilensis]MDR3379551.1 hypothetical protein [Cupriavidus basilensis]